MIINTYILFIMCQALFTFMKGAYSNFLKDTQLVSCWVRINLWKYDFRFLTWPQHNDTLKV